MAGGPEAESPEWPEEYSITIGTQAAALLWTWTIMHVLFWGLGFLLFPDFLNVVASTGTLLLNSSTGKVCCLTSPPSPLPAWSYFPTRRGREWMSFEFSHAHELQRFLVPKLHWPVSRFLAMLWNNCCFVCLSVCFKKVDTDGWIGNLSINPSVLVDLIWCC